MENIKKSNIIAAAICLIILAIVGISIGIFVKSESNAAQVICNNCGNGVIGDWENSGVGVHIRKM